jgi:hypothetical protein
MAPGSDAIKKSLKRHYGGKEQRDGTADNSNGGGQSKFRSGSGAIIRKPPKPRNHERIRADFRALLNPKNAHPKLVYSCAEGVESRVERDIDVCCAYVRNIEGNLISKQQQKTV